MTKTRKLVILAIVIALIAVVAYVLTPKNNTYPPTPIGASPTLDPLNATYTVNGQPVTLVGGKSSVPAAPGSTTQITTSVFGQQANGDLNGDGTPDAAVILVQNDGGSGTFYYVAAAIDVPGGTQGTNAILLGDRITPEGIEIRNGQILASYAERKPGQPFSAAPSVGITEYINYNGSSLVPAGPTVGAGGHCSGSVEGAAGCAAGYHCAPPAGSQLPLAKTGGTCVAN